MHRIEYKGRVRFTPSLREDIQTLQQALRSEIMPIEVKISPTAITLKHERDDNELIYLPFLTKSINYPDLKINNQDTELGVIILFLILLKNAPNDFSMASSELMQDKGKNTPVIGEVWWKATMFIDNYFGWNIDVKYDSSKEKLVIKVH